MWQLRSLEFDGWILVYLVRGDRVILGQPVLISPEGNVSKPAMKGAE